MNYEKYRNIVTLDEFYSLWTEDTLDQISVSMKQDIYKRYVVKAMCFQRDNFKCQNACCKAPESKLTLHHIKFKKNNGKDSIKNCVTLCKSCHSGYHEGKIDLAFWGVTYRLHQEREVNWKEVRTRTKTIRKQNVEYHGISISWDLLMQLMKFLEINYVDFEYSE